MPISFRISMAVIAVTVSPLAAQKPIKAAVVPDAVLYESALHKFVGPDGLVNYSGLKANPAELQAYVSQIARVSPDSAPGLFANREAQLAYWLNAYNALVLQSFVADYPQKRDRLTGLVGRGLFFYRAKHKVGGKDRTLGDIEENTIRKIYREPRIHFALVCASTSCPWLSRTPYSAETLEAQLDADASRYFGQARNFHLDEAAREVTLPRILEWFKDDFGGTQEKILAFVARYRPEESARLTRGTWRIKYFDYDWSPNDRK